MTQTEAEKEFYRRSLDVAKTGPESTGYGMEVNQSARFEVVDRYLPPESEPGVRRAHDWSLLDVGCGTGDYLQHLYDQEVAPVEYLGLDLMPEMVEATSNRIGEIDGLRGRHWEVAAVDVRDLAVTSRKMYDAVISIASLAMCDPDMSMRHRLEYVWQTIDAMEMLARKLVVVTLFSTWKNQHQPDELNVDPSTMLTWALSRWERVELVHSYAPHDFTLAIQLDESEWRRAWRERSQ